MATTHKVVTPGEGHFTARIINHQTKELWDMVLPFDGNGEPPDLIVNANGEYAYSRGMSHTKLVHFIIYHVAHNLRKVEQFETTEIKE